MPISSGANAWPNKYFRKQELDVNGWKNNRPQSFRSVVVQQTWAQGKSTRPSPSPSSHTRRPPPTPPQDEPYPPPPIPPRASVPSASSPFAGCCAGSACCGPSGAWGGSGYYGGEGAICGQNVSL